MFDAILNVYDFSLILRYYADVIRSTAKWYKNTRNVFLSFKCSRNTGFQINANYVYLLNEHRDKLFVKLIILLLSFD
jgi:hypothetical protein